jgi:hypothetical protein
MNLLVLTILVCPTLIKVNHTTFPWNARDYEVIEQAKVRCGKVYKGNDCLVKFFKQGEHDYYAVCGEKRTVGNSIDDRNHRVK